MGTQNTRRTFDLSNPPPLTEQQRAELEALKAMPEDAIDHSDIPTSPGGFGKAAAYDPLYKPIQTSTTVRLDFDMLLWLKSRGKGHQTRINPILREAMPCDIGKTPTP